MADEQNFPTAIVPTQPGTVVQRFDRLARTFGDPMAKLFMLQRATRREYDRDSQLVEVPDTEMQFRAAAELMPYRYPKLKVAEVRHSGAGGAGVNIQINFAAPAPPPTVDVTPTTEEDPLT